MGLKERIRKIITDKCGGSNADFAERIDININTIQKWDDDHLPGGSILQRIRSEFDIDINWLLNDKDGVEYKIGKKKVFQVRSPDPEQEYGPRRAYKVHEALLMATRVLESDTSYADALYLNIQHFDRAIQAEERLSIIEDENKQQLDRLVSLEDECEDLKKRLDILESKTPAPDGGALKKSAAT